MPYVQIDITDRKAVEDTIKKPEAIIYWTTWTAVDTAKVESDENHKKVKRINVDDTNCIEEADKAIDAKMLYLSTDYVFDRQVERPWEPDENYSPLNYYGQIKLEGELAVRILKEVFHCLYCLDVWT